LNETSAKGPLAGLRVIEMWGLGPAPHCAMLLSDMGAEILRIARQGDEMIGVNPVIERGRHSLFLDLRDENDKAVLLGAAEHADVLLEGFRPGVMERLGLGPDVLMAINPRMIYGRITGWGQEGPLSRTAGHDINFIALSGALAGIGHSGRAAVPLNLVGDYGGGSMLLALGILASLHERAQSGKGQVIDAAMVDGVASLMALYSGLAPRNLIDMHRDRNLLSGAAPFYRCYVCADQGEIAIGPLEPKFYAELLKRIGAPISLLDTQNDPLSWPASTEILAAIFAGKTRDEWCALLEGSDACFAPVLALGEAPLHPHLRARGTYSAISGVDHPSPAPRFSRTKSAIQASGDGEALLRRWASGRDSHE
jgi:alpha-methylacyl-CoA racemase